MDSLVAPGGFPGPGTAITRTDEGGSPTVRTMELSHTEKGGHTSSAAGCHRGMATDCDDAPPGNPE